jgi:hypothetical protein
MLRREHFFFLAFLIGLITGWIVLDQLAGNWFERQAVSTSLSQVISLCLLKFALVLTAGAFATMPYVFWTTDVVNNLEMRAREALLTNFSAFVLVDVHAPASHMDAERGNQFRPPRHLS